MGNSVADKRRNYFAAHTGLLSASSLLYLIYLDCSETHLIRLAIVIEGRSAVPILVIDQANLLSQKYNRSSAGSSRLHTLLATARSQLRFGK